VRFGNWATLYIIVIIIIINIINKVIHCSSYNKLEWLGITSLYDVTHSLWGIYRIGECWVLWQ